MSRLSEEDYARTIEVYERTGSQAKTAQEMGLSRSAVQHRLRGHLLSKEREDAAVDLPEFPDDDIPVEEIIDGLSRRFTKRQQAHSAKRWFTVKVKIEGPYGIAWYGDPHLDDNGCNWPLLQHHISLHKNNPALLAASLGDATNNWVGRLLRLYADQDTSKHTARKLARWFLTESGVPWFIWLLGNHDMWAEGDAILRGMNINRIVMEERAQFVLVPPKGHETRVWAEHNFKGHSMWNSLHGPQKAAHMKDMAHLYICGDKHNWALHHEESASRGFCYWLARARGYKYIDQFGEALGHFPQKEGASIISVHDPHAKTMASSVQCFADMDEGVEFLRWKRAKS